jgi:hypothetical protein
LYDNGKKKGKKEKGKNLKKKKAWEHDGVIHLITSYQWNL